MFLVCGATGELGRRIAGRLVERDQSVRALVRPATDAGELAEQGIEVVRGDLRDSSSLPPALAGVTTVITTANALSRILGGEKRLTIAAVDGGGNRSLISAAEAAGVQRFLFLSAAGLDAEAAGMAPFLGAKWAAEEVLRASPMRPVVVRPDMFQEVWLGPTTGIDAVAGKALVYGRGQTPARYVALDDVAALVVHLALAADPPPLVEFGGPDALTRMEVVSRWEQATGIPIKVRHVPRTAMSIGRRVLAPIKPEIASLMGMALHADLTAPTWDDQPLRDAGITPREVGTYMAQVAGV